ncbi:MAG: hypothetical protein CBB69_002975 [Phycisphaera sp. TMED9]|nr:MAG: hypothetical protein CBB69_002975 [Phycisphaera sp. TMED9]
MEQLATLPPVVALRLLDLLHDADIPAETTDMAPGVAAAVYPGLLEATLTVWVSNPEDLEEGRAIFDAMKSDEAEGFDWSECDLAAEEPEPDRPAARRFAQRKRNAHLILLLLWFGPVGLLILLITFLMLVFGGG